MTPLFFKSIKPPVENKPTVKVTKDIEKQATVDAKTPDLGHFQHLMGILAEHKTGGTFGPDVVEPGHHVAFKAGEYTGSGKVCTTGRDGLLVADGAKREHRVHWREVTGHFAPEKPEKSEKPTKAKDAK